MKTLILLLFPMFSMAQWATKKDTIAVTFMVQYTRGAALTLKEGYIIQGKPAYRSDALFTKGKWIFPEWYRWKIVTSTEWITNKK